MHDLHLADRIIKICQKEAKGREVKKIKIKLGKIVEHEEEIKPENLKFNLKMLAKNTNLREANFIIEQTGGDSFKIDYIEV